MKFFRGMVLAGAFLAGWPVSAVDLPLEPPAGVADPIGALDEFRLQTLEDRLRATRDQEGIRVYFASIPESQDGELISVAAAQLLRRWAPDGISAAVIYAGDLNQLAIATSRDAAALDRDRAIVSLAAQSNRRLRSGQNVPQVVRETVLEVDYVLRTRRSEEQAGLLAKYPVTILGAVAGGVLLLVGGVVFLTLARQNNLFCRKVFFPVKKFPQRLGGANSGGHSVLRTYRNSER